MGVRQQAIHGYAWPLKHGVGRPMFGVVCLALVTVAMLSCAAHLTARAHAQRQPLDQVTQALDKLKQELKDSVEGNSRELYKQVLKSGAGWVKDADLHEVVTVGAPCQQHRPRNSSAWQPASRLQLNVTDKLVSPIVVLAHARAHYLAKTVLELHKYRSMDPANAAKFPLFISIDGDHQPSLILATSLTFATGAQIIRVQRNTSNPPCKPPWDAYCNLALHYKTLLQLFFQCMAAPRLIFLEEDLQVAPDFFSYFESTAPLLDQDKSLYCISAWNDQGQVGRVANRTALYRTDVFPGLGWMLTREVGLELMPTWPPGYWDDNHMRKPHIRKGRQCVFPEVPRTHTFGAVGASNGMFFQEHLDNMVINTKNMDWRLQDLSYLTADKYAALMRHWLSTAAPLSQILQDKGTNLKDYCNITQPARSDLSDVYLTYKNNEDFERLGKDLAPMLFSVSGGAQIPRSVYNGTGHGVVIVRCRQRRLFLISKAP